MSEENTQQPQPVPKDLEFLNEPAGGQAPVTASPPPPTPQQQQQQPVMTTGIIVSPAAADMNGAGGGNFGNFGAAAPVGTGGIDELPNGDVIVVFEDQPPQAGEPMINNAVFALSLVLILATMVWPFLVSKDSRLIDLLAFGVCIPAALSFVWVIKSPVQKQFVHPLNVYLKFFIGWGIMLPCAWLSALVCLFFGILAVALFLGITGLKGWFAFAAISVMLVCAIIIPEEVMKLIGAQRDNVRKNIQNPRQYVLYSLFASLGMATFEAYIMVHYIRRALDYGARKEAGEYDTHKHKGHAYGGKGGDHIRVSQEPGMTRAPDTVRDALHQMLVQAITHAPQAMASPATATNTAGKTEPDLVDGTDFIWMFVLCLVCIIPMHVLSGYHVGLGIARRDIMNVKSSVGGILVVPVLFRTSFLYIIWFLPFLTKWDEAGLLALLLIPLYVLLVKRDERKMPRSYLLRSGYMTAFGYGALPEEDEGDESNQGQSMENTEQGDASTGDNRV